MDQWGSSWCEQKKGRPTDRRLVALNCLPAGLLSYSLAEEKRKRERRDYKEAEIGETHTQHLHSAIDDEHLGGLKEDSDAAN